MEGAVLLLLLASAAALVVATMRKHARQRAIGHAPSHEQEVAEQLLAKGSIDVYLDARRPGVRVPKPLAHKPKLILKFTRRLGNPEHIEVDDKAIEGRLLFDGEPFDCKVPFDAVYAIVGEDGMGMVWEEKAPPEVQAEVAQATKPPEGNRA